MKGPLAPYASGLHVDLVARGYSPTYAERQMWLVSGVSRWLEESGLQATDLTEDAVERFLALRRAQGRKVWISSAAMEPLVGYLRRLGAAPAPSGRPPRVAGPDDLLLDEFGAYLVKERGLAPSTIQSYLAVARTFLAVQRAADCGLPDLTAAQITAFVVQQARAQRTGAAKQMVTGLRALLRFLHVSGTVSAPLHQAVPAVASWRATALPKALEPAQIDQILARCDQTTPAGLRDLAIITLLVRLGLRAGEVARLRLPDVDWRRGEMIIRGKANRFATLPVPVDVGEAVVAWLMRGRRGGESDRLFLRLHAPYVGLTRNGVSSAVRAACVRAGLPPVQAHCLRHTAATQMLRSGAGLVAIGQVLRHESLATTAIYAKVDRNALSALALPWPGDAG